MATPGQLTSPFSTSIRIPRTLRVNTDLFSHPTLRKSSQPIQKLVPNRLKLSNILVYDWLRDSEVKIHQLPQTARELRGETANSLSIAEEEDRPCRTDGRSVRAMAQHGAGSRSMPFTRGLTSEDAAFGLVLKFHQQRRHLRCTIA